MPMDSSAYGLLGSLWVPMPVDSIAKTAKGANIAEMRLPMPMDSISKTTISATSANGFIWLCLCL